MGENNKICILSIDGGGIRGIIPAVILAKLEEILKKKNEGGCIMNYFDVIAGTSTGGLIAAMLTSPYAKRAANNTQTTSNGECSGGPYSAQEIKDFYLEKSREIFPSTSCSKVDAARKFFRALWSPKYDGKNLRRIVFEKLGKDKTLDDTFADVVMPTFDIKLLQRKIFSSFEAKSDKGKGLDVPLIADVCIATTAAPTYLPAHHFQVNGSHYNLIDGGVVANNPTLVAIAEALKANDKSFADIDCRNLLVLSLGSGSSRQTHNHSAEEVSKWGLLSWVFKDGSAPIIDAFSQASADLTDYFLSRIFEEKKFPEHYLRIQADVPDKLKSMDKATNIKDLEDIGNRLLAQSTKAGPSQDVPQGEAIEAGLSQDVPQGETIEAALIRFAELLVFKPR